MALKYPLLLLLLLTITSPLFFFKLGQSSLVSFDEAWYAEIAKQLLYTGTPFSLNFNSQPFVDHPPAGFWLIASTQTIFGINEFGSRSAGAVAGLLVLAVIFIFGSLLFHPVVGFSSAIALASSPWFIYRARSANLDIFLTLFFLTTLLLGFISIKKPKYLGAFIAILTVLLLTKTASPFTIFPALLFLYWRSPLIRTPRFKFLVVLSGIILSSYFLIQLINVPGFLGRLLFVGAPKVGGATLFTNINLVKTYLHLGLGAWFKPAILSLPLLLLFRKKKYLYILISLLSFIFPFTLSPKTQIWHLIPAHPLMILIAIGLVFTLINKFSKRMAIFLTLILTLTISVPQIKKNWFEFIDIPAFISDEAILSKAASPYPYPLVIDENFLPAAVFYSGKKVSWNSSRDLSTFVLDNQDTLVITHLWRLNEPAPDKYQIIATDRDKILILYSK